MSKDVLANHRINTIIILVLLVLFVSVIYLPKTIWDYEAELRDDARFRMNTVGLAEKLHYQLSKAYTTDTEQLVLVVNSVRDSMLAAAADTNYSFYGPQRVALPPKSVSVNYSAEYIELYNKLHVELFEKLEPNHFMEAPAISQLLDTVKFLFDQGNYVGEQTLELDSIALSFNVSEKYDILYQNIKTSMFNALTGSYTKYPNFSNPLVDGVMDSLAKNPELDGRVEFDSLYDGSVRVDFIIPLKFEENLQKTLLAFKKNFVMDSYDSATYGDTLYDMALESFLAANDTLDVIPSALTLMYSDTSEEVIEIPVEIKTEDMDVALDKRRNTLYTMLTGYSEPNAYIAEHIIAVAMDSLDSPGVGLDSIHVDIDLSDVAFTINVHRNISEYYHKVSLEQAYYKTHVNLSEIDWEKAAVEVVEYVASRLIKKSDYKKWQIVEAETDTLYVNVFDEFLRDYDDMNLALYEQLTGEFTNIHDYARELIGTAEHLASVDSLEWSGQQTIEFPADTVLVDVFPTFLAEYDTTFTIARDTVVQIDDSTFNGVFYRGKIAVTQDFSLDTLAFLTAVENSNYKYDFNGTDSVKSLNVMEKSDTARVEKIFYGMETYVMIFGEDSLMENMFVLHEPWAYSDSDSIQIDSLNVVSDEFVAGDTEKDLFMSKDSFGGWIDTVVNKKYVKKQLYARYALTKEHTQCPVTELPYRITVRNNVNLSIESPIERPIETNRYLFFTQIDSSHGSIVDGEMSWVK